MNPKLFYPIKPIFVNQAFAKNANSFYVESGMKGHNGIDLRAVHGQPIYATHDGVALPQIDDHGGNGIVLVADGGEYWTVYWHLIDDDAVVHSGQRVKAGDLLAYADNTGRSTGDHLHFGLEFKDADQNNGYKGYTDPQPYFNGLYAQDINNPPALEPKFQFTKTLKMGSWNSEVGKLQTLLKKLGYNIGRVDGQYGNKTFNGVKLFQTAQNLVPDGVFGAKSILVANKLL